MSRKQSLAPLNNALFWAAFTLALYGFLRASEYTSPSPTHYLRQLHLLTQKVTICKEGMEVHIKGSITGQFKNSTTLYIARLGMPTCPVRAMEKFLGQSSHKNSLPLFTFRNGQFLTRIDVSSMTKSLLAHTVHDVSLYSSHSYRIGAATTAAAAGLPDSQIQTLGRWHSSAYRSYIRTSPESQHKAIKQMAH